MSASHPHTGSIIPAHVRIGLGTLACLCLLAGSSFLREAPLSAAPALSSAVQQADAIQDFIRFERMSGPKAELQTSVTTYRHPDTDQLVSLVGVVHIGDPGYFRRIQQELDAHDLVLYELVGCNFLRVVALLNLPGHGNMLSRGHQLLTNQAQFMLLHIS